MPKSPVSKRNAAARLPPDAGLHQQRIRPSTVGIGRGLRQHIAAIEATSSPAGITEVNIGVGTARISLTPLLTLKRII